jgi:hypothetical protein
MAKKSVYISFDYDNDETLKTFLVGQSKHEDSPFDFVDSSIKQALTGDWEEKAKTRIKAVDLLIVICGEKTHTAKGVSAEVTIAQDENIPYFLLKGYSDKTCTKPLAAKTSDPIYKWTWDNLKALVGGAR